MTNSILALREQDLKEMTDKYYELIMAVSFKIPNETRHETALRRIQEAEKPSGAGASCETLPKTTGADPCKGCHTIGCSERE